MNSSTEEPMNILSIEPMDSSTKEPMDSSAIEPTGTSNNEPEPEPELHINQLNDDCLMHIFKFLPYVDRARIESVCKRWYDVSQDNWNEYFRLNPSLEIGTDTGPFPRLMDKTNKGLFTQILRRRGPFLTEISFAEICKFKFNEPGMIELVVEYCPQIKKIHAENMLLLQGDILALARCSQLESLGVGAGIEWMDFALKAVFRSNKKLKHLTVSRNQGTFGMCLHQLQPNVLESLRIIECPFFHLHQKNITRLAYSLTELEIRYDYDPDTINVSQVPELKNLRKLVLSGQPWIMEAPLIAVLHHISRKCLKLEYISIEDICFMARDKDLGPLFNLPELREIRIIGKTNITNQIFADKTLDKLERLTMPCSWLKEQDYENLAHRLPKLKVLSVCDCVISRESKWLSKIREKGINIKIRICGHNPDRFDMFISRY